MSKGKVQMSFADYCRARAENDPLLAAFVAVLPVGDWDYETAIKNCVTMEDDRRRIPALIVAFEDYIKETEGRIIRMNPLKPLTEIEFPAAENILIDPTEEYVLAHIPKVCELLRIFHMLIREAGGAPEVGKLHMRYSFEDHHIIGHVLEFMYGKPLYGESTVALRRVLIGLERERVENLKALEAQEKGRKAKQAATEAAPAA